MVGDPAWTKLADRLNTVCPYFTMFPLDFPLTILAHAHRGQWVLDPFCGRGTTMFAARRLGLGSVGIDVSPIAVAIARAKVAAIDPLAVETLSHDLMAQPQEPHEVPSGEFWDYLYHPDTLVELCWLREQLMQCGDEPVANVLRAITIGILHGALRKTVPTYLSNQMPRTYATKPDAAVRFWKKHKMEPPRVPVLDTVLRRIRFTLEFVPPARVQGKVIQGDARSVLRRMRRRFDWVVTSPPYYGMDTYVADQWLRNWFLGGPPEPHYDTRLQVSQGGVEGFTNGLADVWRWTATRCNPGAVMAIRFGALPKKKTDPEELLRASLEQATTGWAVQGVTDAGQPPRQTRQAHQFNGAGEYGREIDCMVKLKT